MLWHNENRGFISGQKHLLQGAIRWQKIQKGEDKSTPWRIVLKSYLSSSDLLRDIFLVKKKGGRGKVKEEKEGHLDLQQDYKYGDTAVS